jgi:DNA-binding FadR family transcriptional regulator
VIEDQHLQVADSIRDAIYSGDLSPGGQLPTSVELAAEYEVTPQVIRRAMRVLIDRGLILRRANVHVVREGEAASLGVLRRLLAEASALLAEVEPGTRPAVRRRVTAWRQRARLAGVDI